MGDSAFIRRTRYWRAGCTQTCPSGSGGGGWIPLATRGWPPTSCAMKAGRLAVCQERLVRFLVRISASDLDSRVLPVTATDSPSEHRTPVADRPRVGARDHGEPEQSGRVFPACCLRGRLPGWGHR